MKRKVTCGHCEFWFAHSYMDQNGLQPSGNCRRNPPTLVVTCMPAQIAETQWPYTDHRDWCGQAEPRISEAPRD